MDDRIEIFGSRDQPYADLLMGNAIPTCSETAPGSVAKTIDHLKRPDARD